MKHTFSMTTPDACKLGIPDRTIAVTTDAELLDDVCDAFADYLRACGFCGIKRIEAVKEGEE